MPFQSSHGPKHDGLDLQELQRDLARKYRNVGSKVDTIWRNFTPKQREKAMRGSIGDGKVLKHSHDRSLGVLCYYIPEYNLRDMTSKPEHFLDMFKFRASTSIYDQLYEAVNGGPGDRELMEQTGMLNTSVPKEAKTVFIEGEYYGQSFAPKTPGKLFPELTFENANLLVIPTALGHVIVSRQMFLLAYLNPIVAEILDLGSETRTQKGPEKSPQEALATALTHLNIQPKPLKSSLPELRMQAVESKAALEDYLHLLRTEPDVLNQAVNAAYWSRAALVPDDRGRILPAITDRHLSAAFFDSITTAVKTIAIWDYILRLLQLLEDGIDKIKRGLVMQELSNICHLEFRRAQESFKRSVAPQGYVASKRFKRLTDNASGQSKIVMKGQPADCTVSDPQLHYILRLCHSETSPAAAVRWIQKLDDHNARHDEDRERLYEPEVAALGELAIIVSFMHTASTAVSMSPLSRKSGLLFSARAKEPGDELDRLKPNADFGDYLVPANNLLEPEMATRVLASLDDFIIQGTGARLGSLYEDVVQDSLADLEKMYAQTKAKLDKVDKQTTFVPLPAESSPSGGARLACRRAKEKTRPAGSSVYTITAPPETSQLVVTEPVQQHKVKAATASNFATLFSKSEARSSVSWASFESAMADLGFSVTPNGGSVFTFNPPASMDSRPITLHRPHVSEIEGYKLLIIAGKLRRAYGWRSDSFVVT
jgi:hypothetical protein